MTSDSSLHASLVLASRFDNIEIAEKALVELCRKAGCSEDSEYWLVTAVREAVANAIRHGNQQDPQRSVHVDYRFNGADITIRVEDEGEGFELEEVPDPTAPENLLRPSGRGIFYMRQFMDHVEFGRTQDGGTSVVMVRKIEKQDDE